MIDQRRLSVSDIVIGEALPWDVYGEGNRLLLRRGQVVQNLRQVEELVQRGLFINADVAQNVGRARSEPPEKKLEIPSALHLITLATRRLERLLYNLGNEEGAQTKIMEVVKALTYAHQINSDIVLASIFLKPSGVNYAVRHCVDTAALCLPIARALNKPAEDTQAIMAAALTMNLGLLRQQDQLQDRQEPLGERERQLIAEHPLLSATLLEQAGIDDPAWLSYVRLHHENPDGSGYPSGAIADAVPQSARIVAMADRFCAAVSDRKYRKSLLTGPALRDVLMAGGKASDPLLAAYFIKELGPYPPGTFVRLQSGEICVVTQRTKTPGEPVVHALIGPRGAPLSFPIRRDTAKDLYKVREAVAPDQAPLRFSMQQLWGDEAAP